jgi:hypothetical protein
MLNDSRVNVSLTFKSTEEISCTNICLAKLTDCGQGLGSKGKTRSKNGQGEEGRKVKGRLHAIWIYFERFHKSMQGRAVGTQMEKMSMEWKDMF